MIVCLCRGVSERDIRALVAQGARSPEALTASCGAGADCGSCMLWLTDYLAESDATLVTQGGRS
jgi:bacterioferritin-associated ferredoxin